MEIEVEWSKFDWLGRERIPGLPPEGVTEDRLDIFLVGKLEDEDCPTLQRLAHLVECPAGIRHMMQGADHGGGIEGTAGKGQMVNISSHVAVVGPGAQVVLGLYELGARIVYQSDLLETGVAEGVASSASAQL